MNDTDTRVNWREIDTTTTEGRRALDVEIARRLGKNVFTALSEREWQFDQNREWVSEYYVEDGRIYEVAYYTSDLNAAYTLPVENEAHSVLIRYPLAENPNERYQGVRADMNGIEGREWNAEPAAAYALAWLAWHDAKSDKLSASDTD